MRVVEPCRRSRERSVHRESVNPVNIDKLASQPCFWLRAAGRDSDVVVSSCLSLSRNLEGFSFVGRSSAPDLVSVIRKVEEAAEQAFQPTGVSVFRMDTLSAEDASLLVERQLASREFIESKCPRVLLVSPSEDFCVMVNGDDHVRMVATNAGFALRETWSRLSDVDDALEERLVYSFDDEFGFLTSCPSTVGTGLRASVTVHIPGLIETNHARKVMRSLEKLNLAARGRMGESGDNLGDLFEISSQATLGSSEDEIIEMLRGVVASVVGYERRAREEILAQDRVGLDDRCSRSLGALSSAREMSFAEATTHLSNVRLGVHVGLINDVSASLVDELIVASQPSHLRRLTQEEQLADPMIEEDELRALYLRRKLKE